MTMTFTLTGRIVRSPEIVPYNDGDTSREMARITVAADRAGTVRKTDFYDIAVFGDTNVAQLKQLTAGDPITLAGRVQQDVWTDDTGTTHYGFKFLSNNLTAATPRDHVTAAVAREAQVDGSVAAGR